MYEYSNQLETALVHFVNRIDIIVALKMGGKIDSETAYQNIKIELKTLKKSRKKHKKDMR